ncbi:DEAD/DEAH box helicase [Bifidobacterium leontopitheci]|uniref:Helicase n=1 Tax=Bifidobacterium leontopitheci TaxID=2650774 RepID=A0A6I1GG96_9BIFI|nr:DEAD/DEAH box helicase [Bifidobacterium leontopitheci]KAB7790640.1 helicase [Bifidobacterium leontopitheci]
MDWRSSVYGSRSGGAGGYGDYDDYNADDDTDGAVFGASGIGAEGAYGDPYADFPIVSDVELRHIGGNALYYRAKDVLKTRRMHDCAVSQAPGEMLLTALVKSADMYADDYHVSATVDVDEGELIESDCTCPAYSSYHGACKHVVALIMEFNDHRDVFRRLADAGDADGAAPGRASARGSQAQSAVRTSRSLSVFMSQLDGKRQTQAKSRQLDLLKEIGDIAAAGGTAAGAAGQGSRYMPIGSVALRLLLSVANGNCVVRLRIEVPSRGVSYVVKSIDDLLMAVHRQEFVSYGKKLAFVHTRDAFDVHSRRMLDILSRAQSIRNVVGGNSGGLYGYSYYRPKSADAELTLSDGEIADLLDTYVGTDDTVEYTPPARFFEPTLRTSVVDGNPDLGLAVVPADSDGRGSDGKPSAYLIRHTQRVERFIDGGQSHYVIVRPLPGTAISDSQRPSHHRSPFVTAAAIRPTIHRCSAAFAAQRELLTMLCADDANTMTLSARDVDQFARTVLPQLQDGTAGAGSASTSGNADGGMSSSADAAVPITLPPEIQRLVRVPCRIEFYLDRDRRGVTCDAQARYGDERYHVFEGIGTSAADARRDKDAERLAVEAVLHYFPRPSGPVAAIAESDDDAIYKLLTEGLPVLRGLGTVFATPAFDGLTATPRPVIKVGLSVRSGLVEISPIADEVDPDEVPALLASYRKRRRFHRLRNGAFVDMRNVDASAVDEVADDLGLKAADFEHGSVNVPAYEAYYLDHQVDEDDKDDSFTAYLDDLRVVDPDEYQVPESLAHVLRPYQVEGFRWLSAVCDKGFGGILADEMGLGKTVQLLSLLLARQDEARAAGRPSLIVCPASLVYNWVAEARKFAPQLRVAAVAGTKGERRAVLDSAQAGGETMPDLLVTSYDLLRRDIDDYADCHFHVMALDEAQYVKNPTTKIAKAVRMVDAAHRFALTGTPIENRLSELWSIIGFLMPGMLGSYAHFRERFELPVLSGSGSAQAKLQAFVGPFILRRLKSQVLKDLPDKIENVITVQLTGEQRKLYAALEQQLRQVILKQKPKDFNTGKIQILAQLTRLRQVCCDPRLLFENAGEVEAAQPGAGAAAGSAAKSGRSRGDAALAAARKAVAKPGAKVSSAKLDAIVDLVDSCRDAGRKMLIFSQFTSYLDLIAERLRAGKVAYDMITGATPKKKRLELVDRFNADETPVFLISLKAGNTGLNLTGACVVVHADPWWNAAAQNQATDRAHRIGQTRDVNVYQIVAKDTIEERILDLQHSKTDLAERFVDSAASTSGKSMASLTKDDLLALLG